MLFTSTQSTNDYYPFGSQLPHRGFDAGSYKFGFNGKENDDEVYGDGNFQDYGMRMYDTRVGRFVSVDPLTKSYPWYAPYQFTGNSPILFIDLDGGERKKYENCPTFEGHKARGSQGPALTLITSKTTLQIAPYTLYFYQVSEPKPNGTTDVVIDVKHTDGSDLYLNYNTYDAKDKIKITDPNGPENAVIAETGYVGEKNKILIPEDIDKIRVQVIPEALEDDRSIYDVSLEASEDRVYAVKRVKFLGVPIYKKSSIYSRQGSKDVIERSNSDNNQKNDIEYGTKNKEIYLRQHNEKPEKKK